MRTYSTPLELSYLALTLIPWLFVLLQQRGARRDGIRAGVSLLMKTAYRAYVGGTMGGTERLKFHLKTSDYVLRLVDGRKGNKFRSISFIDRVAIGDFILRVDYFAWEATFSLEDPATLKEKWSGLQAEWVEIENYLRLPRLPFRHLPLH